MASRLALHKHFNHLSYVVVLQWCFKTPDCWFLQVYHWTMCSCFCLCVGVVVSILYFLLLF